MDGENSALLPLYSHFGDDPIVAALLPQFFQRLQMRVSLLQEHFSAGLWHEVGKLAHELRGATGQYGYPELSSVFVRIQQAAQGSPVDHSHMRAQFAELALLLQRISKGVAKQGDGE